MKVIEEARKYVGMKEKPQNSGFYNPTLQAIMTKAGQKSGEAWCAYFAEAMFCEAYPENESKFRKLFNAGAVQTYKNFVAAGYKPLLKPRPGDLVIWQKYTNGMAGWQGHAGIVSEVINDVEFKSIEGNTKSNVGTREGDSVQEKTRKLVIVNSGLNVLGFITIV